MNRLLHWLLKSELGRRVELQLLANLVTKSLTLPRKRLLAKPSNKALEEFAALTASYLETSTDASKQLLHKNAFKLGARLRSILSRRDDASLTELIFLLYSNIGISMEGRFPGKVTVSKCYFCHHYSPHICSIASLMDSGVICGLMGGGNLEFSKRITEGNTHCLCEFTPHK